MYGAINEQIRALAEKGIASRIVPGVSSVFGAAAALGCELTCPDVSQSVVLTRTPGRKRRHLLTEALDIFREQRGGDVLCAYVRHAGRPQEAKWIGRLDDFPADEVDMSTLVIIGGPRTITDAGAMYEARGYVEKYME